ncbi:hypothetical protein D7X55_34405 [Corallococcus sp. AB049A]|uniref:Uncharacterized protein n=1 Tax=Corallococcus interemptor TaxID=2316720 RepID=A0A3A8PXV5_9BACT|nr:MULTISPECIES: hypothetical protein [Corallococcus]RKH40555.1 hypothetical protein D7Y23_34505 [Corallococcus sp. AB050B]RKH58605.1 hypothetical protein D7X96_36635 [Corallococcus interemptor]RKI51301.1 hypothetical protein D7X55_34405 [Corallococcus sp. AB049A]
MNPDSPLLRRVVFASALYDFVVTVPFATPWTADAVLSSIRSLHHALGLGGEALPAFTSTHLFFVALFGTIVTLWSVVRLVHPTAFNGAIDTVGRALFSTWMAWSLAQGATRVLVVFLVLELAWMFAQGGVILGARRWRGGIPATAR